VDEDVIRDKPQATSIPFFTVDAVVEARYGSHPCLMPYMYYFDEHHIAEWLKVSATDDGVQEYLDRYVYGVKDFAEYLEAVGGERRMEHLERVEHYQEALSGTGLEKGGSR